MSTIPNWREKFAHDFRTKKFTGESLEENTEQAIKYFTDYFTSEIETAEQRGIQRGREEMRSRMQIEIQERMDLGSTAIDEDFLQSISSLK